MSRSIQSCANGGWPKHGCCANCRSRSDMDPERFIRVEELYYSVLLRPVEERSRFLREACGPDENLRREVESLLAYDAKAGQFMETPAIDLEAAVLART